MTTLGILWFVIVAVLMAGYFILDGFDLGAGMLYPLIAKDEREKRAVLRAIGPVWDGNEVWLLTAGGALFAAFAPAYAATFSGFYLAIMLVLFGLILRAVALEYRAHEDSLLGLWDALVFVGSLLPALLFGVALGNVVQGIPLDANGDYTGTFFALLNPFALLCGLAGLAHMLLQGSCWVALKAPAGSALRGKAAGLRPKLAAACLALFAATVAWYFGAVLPGVSYAAGSPALAAVAAAAYLAATAAVLALGRSDALGRDLPLQLLASAGALAIIVVVAASLFPNLVPATDATFSLTIANSASSDTALSAMTVIAAIGVPLMLVYQVIAYRTFRGRVEG